MKKVKPILLSLILMFILVGCVSDSEYKELEERVSYLEKQLNNKGSNVEPEDNTESYHEDKSNSEGFQEDEINDSIKEVSYTYIIDALSDADVINECNYYFINIPSQGESYEEYYAKLKAIPVNTFEKGGVECHFYDYTKGMEQTDHDVITEIRIIGTQTEMDGTIGYRENYYGVKISMLIQDYVRASNIYAQLFDIVSSSGKITEVKDVRDSMHWGAQGSFWTSDSVAIGETIMSMEKQDEGYYLTATYFKRME